MAATTVYAIVEDPSMAPLTILETLLSSGLRNPAAFSAMGTARRGTSKDDIKSLGSGIAALDVCRTARGWVEIFNPDPNPTWT
ncbi:hypothetical protein N7463_004734 [Penicillium fimorum]|uniref:Uncharacterized protein n=1 Tax=Penicillium fimorum TaxID=1882269 RepID=A0A9X0C4Z7_9EURO|nr:hypothetical protein N7463_004734 [Penicillium fimorum]